MAAGRPGQSGDGALTAEDLFAGSPAGLALHDAVADLVSRLDDVETRVTRSQVAFRRRRGFAWVWRPDRYVHSAVPAVLSLALPRHDDSPRWKEVAHPSATVWMHHLELSDPGQLDAEVVSWLAEAWEAAA